jgi:hypothetical protein
MERLKIKNYGLLGHLLGRSITQSPNHSMAQSVINKALGGPLICGALGTRAQAAKIIEGIDATRVPVVPEDLQSIAAYQFGPIGLQRFPGKYREGIGRLFRGRAELPTGGAGALAAQITVGIRAQVAIRPPDGEGVVVARELDRCGVGVHVWPSPVSDQPPAVFCFAER